MGVLFITLFYATLHVSAYKQAIFKPKDQLLRNYSVADSFGFCDLSVST
jgi:hypothetical protein